MIKSVIGNCQEREKQPEKEEGMKQGKVLGVKPSNFWAIEIGEGHVCAVRLQKHEDDYCLRDFFWQDFEFDTAAPDFASAQKSAQLSALEELLKRAGINGQDAVLSISSCKAYKQVHFLPHFINWDEVTDKKIAYRILSMSLLEGKLDQCLWDYCLTILKATNQCLFLPYHILVSALTRDYAESFISVLEAHDCRLHGISIDSLDSYNWLKYRGWLDKNPTRLIIIEKGFAKIVYQNAYLQQGDGLVYGFDDVPLIGEGDIYGLISRLGRVVLTGSDYSTLDLDWLKELNVDTTYDDIKSEFLRVGWQGDTDNPLMLNQLTPVLGLALSCHQKVAVEVNLLSQL